jgi:hypothetical protein
MTFFFFFFFYFWKQSLRVWKLCKRPQITQELVRCITIIGSRMFAVRSGCRRPRRPAPSACLSLPRPDVSPPACRIPFWHTLDTDPQPAHCTPMQCFLCDPRCRLDSEWLPQSFPTAHAQNMQYFNIISALNCDGVEMCR